MSQKLSNLTSFAWKKKDTTTETREGETDEAMKTKTQKVLPKIPLGTVHTQFKKCGKSNCKCVSGELHGAYFYHFFRINGKLFKRYLKSSEVEEVRKMCKERQQEKQLELSLKKKYWTNLREIREQLREIRSYFE